MFADHCEKHSCILSKEDMHLSLPAFVRIPVAAASAHALLDTKRLSPVLLSKYTFSLTPLSECVSVSIFLLCSVFHFKDDVGWIPSLLLHMMWTGLHCFSFSRLAWGLFATYYVVVHSLPSLRQWYSLSPAEATLTTLLFACAGTMWDGSVSLFALRVITCHCLLSSGRV